ncbi:MAG: hypothetical protein J2P57_12315 [Acidimicrobiaceae bacterium]|nr:hypothetical protein [Acidimicrobiaceae bacterium]
MLVAIVLAVSACSDATNQAARQQNVQWGLQVQNSRQGPIAPQLRTDNTILNHPATVTGMDQDWSCASGYGAWNFDKWMTGSLAKGLTPMIAWEPGDGCSPAINVARIVSGAYDSYIHSWARGAARLRGKPTIYLRLMHEPNITAYPWGYQHLSGAQYDAAWKHVYHIFRAQGATNVKFVWNFAGDVNNTAADMRAYYPGDQYVDYVGWDQYQNNDVRLDYKSAQTIAPSKPIALGEVGGTDNGYGGYQALRDLMDGLAAGSFPAIKEVTYFDVDVGGGVNGDFTLANNPNMAAFIRSALAGPASRGRVRWGH